MSGEGGPSTTPPYVASPTTTTPSEIVPQPSVGSVKQLFDAMESYHHANPDGPKDSKMVPNMFSSYDEMNNIKEKTELIPTTLYPGLTLASLWSTVFASTSNFWRNYKEKRGDTKMDMPKWDIDPTSRSFGSRMYMCHAMVEGSPTPFFEAGRFAMARDLQSNSAKMTMHLSAQTPEVICGTTFRVEAVMNFEETKEGVTVRILGGCRKMAGRFSFIKGLAEPRACSEMKKGYVTCLAQLKEALPPPPSGAPTIDLPAIVESPSLPASGSPTGGSNSSEQTPSQLSMMLGGFRPEAVLGLVLVLALMSYFLFFSGAGNSSPQAGSSFGGSPGSSSPMSEDRLVEDLLSALAGQPGQQTGTSGHRNSDPHHQNNGNNNNGHTEVLMFRTHLLEERVASLEWKLSLAYFLLLLVAAFSIYNKVAG